MTHAHARSFDEAFLDDPALIESRVPSCLLRGDRPLIPPRLIARLARQWEGGAGLSRTLRRLLLKCNGVRAGTYSYGNLMDVSPSPSPGLDIGRYVSMSYTVRWGLPHPLNLISTSSVFYEDSWGDYKLPAQPPKLEICSDAWIGDNVVITGNCNRIGFGAAVGAGAIVTRDVPDFAIVIGAPARLLRFRFDEQVRERLLESRWWDMALTDLEPWQPAFRAATESSGMLGILDEIIDSKKRTGQI